MARLSQRAMNNVVIIAMLVMIALFNLNSFLPAPAAPELRPLVPSDAYVLKIEQGSSKLERNGQQWRQVSSKAALPVSGRDQIEAWRQGRLKTATLTDNAFKTIEPIVVVVWLAGEANGQVYAFYANTHPATVKFHHAWYTLEDVDLGTLLPWLSEPAT